jgi:hypothetical protein
VRVDNLWYWSEYRALRVQRRQAPDAETGSVFTRDNFTECGWQKSIEGNGVT